MARSQLDNLQETNIENKADKYKKIQKTQTNIELSIEVAVAWLLDDLLWIAQSVQLDDINNNMQVETNTEKDVTVRACMKQVFACIFNPFIASEAILQFMIWWNLIYENCVFGLEEVLKFKFLQWLVAFVK